MMDLNALFRRPYENVAEPMPDMWKVLRLTTLPKAPNAQVLNKFRGISLIDAMAKLYTSALTRLLRSELVACAPAEFHRPLVFGYEAGAAANGMGLCALFQKSFEW